MEIGLSLGSNLGDRLANLSEARRRLGAVRGIEEVAGSPVYETEPVGVKPEYQHLKFLNAVLIVSSSLAIHDFFDRLREVENTMGRQRTLDRYAPRNVDIDIIYAGNSRIESGGLVIPHPRWAERAFVVRPLADVRPDLIVPGYDRPVREIWRSLDTKGQVKLFARDW